MIMMTRPAKIWFAAAVALCLALGLTVFIWRPAEPLPPAQVNANESASATRANPGSTDAARNRPATAEPADGSRRVATASPTLPLAAPAVGESEATDPVKGKVKAKRPATAAPELSYEPASEPAPHNASSDGFQLAAGTNNPDLVALAGTVRDFRAALGENPVGNNAEITRALLGDNPRHTQFLSPEAAVTNPAGELLDRWGHPYFFHAISRTEMEVHSAGPDGVLWSADDQAFH